MRLKLTLAYDGTPYKGWQKQPNALTVQGAVEEALSVVAKQTMLVNASGRTDAGVHANGQVLHFDPPPNLTMNPYNWVPALNTNLPPSIRALSCEEVAKDFHSRFNAVKKTYSYLLILSPILHPHLHHRAWHLPRQLDLITLEEALSFYKGTHDFRAFAALRGNETETTDYHRTIHQAELKTVENGYRLCFEGNGFLYKMVRLLTGAAVQAAQGRLRLDDLYALIHTPQQALKEGKKVPFCAPPDGLILEKVDY